MEVPFTDVTVECDFFVRKQKNAKQRMLFRKHLKILKLQNNLKMKIGEKRYENNLPAL